MNLSLKRFSRIGVVTAAVSVSLFLAACQDEEDASGSDEATMEMDQSNLPPANRDITVTGIVRDRNDNALEGAMVTIVGKGSASTDANGFYAFDVVNVDTGERLLLNFERDGFASTHNVIDITRQTALNSDALMLNRDIVDTDNDRTVDNSFNDGGSTILVEVPANSLEGGADGNYQIEISRGDPTTTVGMATFPGEFLGTASPNAAQNTLLESIVFVDITVTDANGNEITEIDDSNPATVTLLLPAVQQAKFQAGDTIAWWSFEELTGNWVREDAFPNDDAKFDADVIQCPASIDASQLCSRAQITHLSWWNVDAPIEEHSVIQACVVDQNGEPVPGISVIAEGVTYSGTSLPAESDDDCIANLTVKRSTPTQTERVIVYAQVGSISIPYDVTDAVEGDVDSDEVNTPTEQGSTLREPRGESTRLQNNIVLNLSGTISGTVTSEVENAPAADVRVFSSSGDSTLTGADGRYQLEGLLVGSVINVSVPQAGVETVQLTEAQPNAANVDFVLPNLPPEITALVRNPATGSVNNNQNTQLIAEAFDPEGQPLTVNWSSTLGSFGSPSSLTTSWTAPSSSRGTEVLTLTVTDSLNATAVRTIAVPYGSDVDNGGGSGSGGNTGGGGDDLSLTFVDDEGVGVANAAVALHGNDKRTIASQQLTNSEGNVLFTDIVGPASVSAAVMVDCDEDSSNDIGEKRSITSIIDLPTGSFTIPLAMPDCGSFGGGEPSPMPVNITAQFDDVPTDSNGDDTSTRLYVRTDLSPPRFAFSQSGVSTFNIVQLNSELLQSNSTVDAIAVALEPFDQRFGDQIIEYGFLTDQMVAEGTELTGSMDQSAGTLTVNVSSSDNINQLAFGNIAIRAQPRRGEFSPELPEAFLDTANNELSGNIGVVDQFPADRWLIGVRANLTSFSSSTSFVSVYNNEDSVTMLPASFSSPLLDIVVTGVGYADGTRDFTVNATGDGAHDIRTAVINPSETAGETAGGNDDAVMWTIIAPPGTDNIPVPQAPLDGDGQPWTVLDNPDTFALSHFELQAVSGYADFWEKTAGASASIDLDGDEANSKSLLFAQQAEPQF